MPGPLGKFVFRGALPAGDVFQYAFHVAKVSADPWTIAELATAADAFATNLSAGGSPITGLYSSLTTWNAPKVQIIDPATKKVVEEGFGTVAMAGTLASNTVSLPPGVAVCVTLRAHGPTKDRLGRFYLPPPVASSCTSLGRILPASLATLAGGFSNAFLGLQATAPAADVQVYSGEHLAYNPCYSSDIGDVYDSMRTRRDKLIENRTVLFNI